MYVKTAVLVAAVGLLAGCATVFTGVRDDITIESTPPGARVFVGGLDYGQTPVTFPLRRDAVGSYAAKQVTVKKEGYADKTFPLQQQFNIVSACNVANLLFWGIDVLSGAVLVYDPTRYAVTLERAATQAPLPMPPPQLVAPQAPPGKQAYVPREGDPFDFVTFHWGKPEQSSVTDGVTKHLYSRPDATYLISVSAAGKIVLVQSIQR